jgi:hypothetical protein
MSQQNHWITCPKYDVIRWAAFLPPPRGDAEALIEFGRTLADSGERNAVWKAQRLPGATRFDAKQQSYESYLRDAVRTRQRIPLPRDVQPGEELWAPARVAFYRGDDIVEEEVGDLGELLQHLWPEKDIMSARSASPVTIRGVSVPIEDEHEVLVVIRLDTDIWCPRVIGLGEPDDGEELPDSYDNRALAEIHTPRLNVFVREVRAATLAIGGRWETWEPDGFGRNYIDQWDEFGIHL